MKKNCEPKLAAKPDVLVKEKVLYQCKTSQATEDTQKQEDQTPTCLKSENVSNSSKVYRVGLLFTRGPVLTCPNPIEGSCQSGGMTENMVSH
jgi:hypothetical protein